MAAGGAIRSAAKFVAAGIRGAQPLGQSVRSLSSSHTAASWEVDDWEVADGDEVVMETAGDTPRVVFGGAPSFQEAKAATTELKHAIDKIYLSSDSAECEGSPSSQASVLSPSHSELENKTCVIEAISNPSAPNPALQAFQLLSQSSEAQTVVASIASDPNIWNAIVQNPSLQDFFQSKHTVLAGSTVEGTLRNVGELPYSDSGYGFVDSMSILHNVKLTIAEMVSSVSNYLQNIFGYSTGCAGADAGGNTKANSMDHIAMGGTFMLALLVVMVIVLKRA